ncbi:MAG: MmcQ/YjbR family DNA-binding protein [Candidatus Cohnella colombiensis]|uniref:MmcQ/YjbR family DNA-binding protein n=1 Tax=Candidatus Cohnella colombiensis TaxID=3121368 RepID=A0AA95F070_9BACL|nr:MAG: MmcQ/YjbR family DNA-binding protein [Cohnella sp.]
MDREALFKQSPEHLALFEKIQTLCISFPGTSERLSHGTPTFYVNDKRSFVQYWVNHHNDGRIALWGSAAEGVQSILIESNPEIYFRPPYVGHLGWIGMRLDRNAAWTETSGMIEDAYLNRAPKKYKEMINKN